MQSQNKARRWWQIFLDSIEELPPSKQVRSLAGLAIEMAKRGERREAAPIALRAWQESRQVVNSADSDVVRRALLLLVPRYHAQISSDATRIATWQAALKDVVKPGMLALEIGTGSGILAMLAARAGAHVVSCESDPVMADIANVIVEQNGFADRIKIVPKSVSELQLSEHLSRPADMLLLDLFGDKLFNFRPFDVLRAASPLLRPDAVVMPMRVSLQGALADFRRWNRVVPGCVSDFDISPLRDLSATSVNLDAGDPDLVLRSDPVVMVEAFPAHKMPPPSGASTRDMISNGGTINGVAVWLRMDLSQKHVLEARPGQAPRGFYARPRFIAFPQQSENRRVGQSYSVRCTWDDARLDVSLVETDRPRTLVSQ